MLKKALVLSGAGLALLGLAACESSAQSTTTEDYSIPTPIAEATVIDKNTEITKNTQPIYGAPTVSPGLPNPYTTTTTKTNYILTVSHDEGNVYTTNWEVSEFAFNICSIGYTAVKYSDGNTVCHAPTPEGEENSENPPEDTVEEGTVEEEITEPVEEEKATVPNGFADKE